MANLVLINLRLIEVHWFTWICLLLKTKFGESQNQCLGIIHLVSTENVPKKTNIFSPLIRTHTCAYQGVRNICFSENFAYILHE